MKSILCPLGKEQISGIVSVCYAQVEAKNTYGLCLDYSRPVPKCPVCVEVKSCSGLKMFVVTHISPFRQLILFD